MEKTDERRVWPWMLLALLVVGVLWFVIGWCMPTWFSHRGAEATGQLGDSFGVVNSLFSGLAFAGVIIAILLQRDELKLQRKELKLTREQVARTAQAQEASERALAASALVSMASITTPTWVRTMMKKGDLEEIGQALLERALREVDRSTAGPES